MTKSTKISEMLQRPHTAIMGIINITPDSFSDGGAFIDPQSAIAHAESLVFQGADILDIGGESTRPGAEPVSVQQELDRVLPVIEGVGKITDVPISIDTNKAEVMTEAVKAGAAMINDVNALRSSGAVEAAAKASVPVCLMHMLGDPRTMQDSPRYDNVVEEVVGFLANRVKECESAGIDRSSILIDPGIGFGKSLQHNLNLLQSVTLLRVKSGCEVLIGVSRKSMIDSILGRSVDQRVSASVGLAVQASINGAKIVRVHDVRATYDAIRCVEAVNQA